MISYEELTKKHEIKGETIKETLRRALATDSVLLYMNQMFDSSCFGRSHLVLCGPGRSIGSAEDAPKWIDPDNCGGLPSRREQLVGEVDIEDLRRNQDV
jgi:hypothetical protein